MKALVSSERLEVWEGLRSIWYWEERIEYGLRGDCKQSNADFSILS